MQMSIMQNFLKVLRNLPYYDSFDALYEKAYGSNNVTNRKFFDDILFSVIKRNIFFISDSDKATVGKKIILFLTKTFLFCIAKIKYDHIIYDPENASLEMLTRKTSNFTLIKNILNKSTSFSNFISKLENLSYDVKKAISNRGFLLGIKDVIEHDLYYLLVFAFFIYFWYNIYKTINDLFKEDKNLDKEISLLKNELNKDWNLIKQKFSFNADEMINKKENKDFSILFKVFKMFINSYQLIYRIIKKYLSNIKNKLVAKIILYLFILKYIVSTSNIVIDPQQTSYVATTLFGMSQFDKKTLDNLLKKAEELQEYISDIDLDRLVDFKYMSQNAANDRDRFDELIFKLLKFTDRTELQQSFFGKIRYFLFKTYVNMLITSYQESEIDAFSKASFATQKHSISMVVRVFERILKKSTDAKSFIRNIKKISSDAYFAFKQYGLFKGLKKLIEYDTFYILSALISIILFTFILYYVIKFITELIRKHVDIDEKVKKMIEKVSSDYVNLLKNFSMKNFFNLISSTIGLIFVKIKKLFSVLYNVMKNVITLNSNYIKQSGMFIISLFGMFIILFKVQNI